MTFHTTAPFVFTSSLLSFFLLLYQQSLSLSLHYIYILHFSCIVYKHKTKQLFFFFSKTMSSIMNSQSMVLATAMVVSSTVLILAFSKQKPFSPFANLMSQDHSKKTLRSCLYSEEKKKQKKKKRVHFAENVKETAGNGEEYRRAHTKKLTTTTTTTKKVDTTCRNENPQMPPNRIALYNGILRGRVHRIECSY